MSDNELRWQLRQLPRERAPGRDLWPGIAGRIERSGQDAGPHRRWPVLLALAASVTLAAALGLRFASQPVAPPAGPDPESQLVLREAAALTVEYRAALALFEGAPVPEPIAPALHELDSSAERIRMALDSDPQALYLLDQLRRTYARRLELTQRATLG